MSYYALVPAAGSGSRMSGLYGASTPKQYLPLAGHPMIWHALVALSHVPAIERVFIVLAPDDKDWMQFDMSAIGPKLMVLRCGGATRAITVRNGLGAVSAQVDPEDWILVHDAARPCITVNQIETLIASGSAGENSVGGLLAIPLADTLKRGSANDPAQSDCCYVDATVSREGFWQAQTPQMFRFGVLQEALARAPHVTDEASAIELLGLRPRLVESSAMNLKVTYPCDYKLAEMILQSRPTP